jgi:AAA domain-containing protein/PEGA domain-containing protein
VSTPGTITKSGFFVTGGTLPRDAACYVRREADERLYASLRRSDICYALTPRQMGKSSLMVQTAARLRERQINVALLDLTAFGQNLTPEQWYYGLAGRIGQQLNLEDEIEDYWNTHLHVGPLQRFGGVIRDVVLRNASTPVVIFIDEIDAVRSLPFSTDEFFAAIREFYNRRAQDRELTRLTFCLLGVATPSDLIRDTRTTPFNIGTRVELSDFTVEEAAALSPGLCADVQVSQKLIRRILYWTGGHPYLTQRLCLAVSGCASREADVDRICNGLFLSYRARERDDNLLFVRERMLRNESDRAALLLLYKKIYSGSRIRDNETNPLIGILRLSGLVRVDHGYLRVRNRIYAEVFNREWIVDNLPGAELRRQRAAYQRGFKIGGAIFAPLLLVLGTYEGYQVYRGQFRSSSPSLPEAPKPPAFWASFTNQSLQATERGTLTISAGEANSSVFLNGAEFGRTEKGGILQIPLLPPGSYEIRVEKPGFQAVLTKTQVLAQRETRLSFTLSPVSQVVAMENLLRISLAPADTNVILDGRPAGMTNASGEFLVKVQPGEHEITLEKQGYVSRTVKQRLSAGSNLIEGQLQPDREPVDLDGALRSGDLARLQDFLNQYPHSKSIGAVRAKIEDLEWSKIDHNDETQLQEFMNKYPNGRHFQEATQVSSQLQQDDMDWHVAQTTGTIESMQSFVDRHPRSRHISDANTAITRLKDRVEIAQVLRDYQDSYNRRDLKQLLQLWPKCPVPLQTSLSTLFKEKRSGTLNLTPTGTPVVSAGFVQLPVEITKKTPSGDSSLTVPFLFKKENDHWIIEKGSL